MIPEESLQIDLFGVKKKSERAPYSTDFSENTLISFKYNSHLKKSIRCLQNGIFGKPVLVFPVFMRNEAFAFSRELAATWAELVVKRKTKKNKEKLKELITRFWGSVDQTLVNLGEEPLTQKGKLPPINPKGKFHDLEQIFDAVNETYFNGELKIKITWSKKIGGLSFHSIRQDPFTGENVHLISISRGYDMENCPFYAIAGVVYHECLHVAIPPEIKNGRRVVHSPLFKKREKRYIYYAEWSKWHKEILPLNIAKLKKQKK